MSEFYVDILDASGNKLGDGPLITLTSLADEAKLDGIGAASFSLPAADPRTRYLSSGAQYDLYDRVDGYLGRYLHKSRALSESHGVATLQVEAYNQLKELARETVGLRRAYAAQAVDVVVASLVGLASGWSVTCDSGLGLTSVTYEGESILTALDRLAKVWNCHYRLAGTRQLEFGVFGQSSGVMLGQPRTGPTGLMALVDQVRLVEETDEIVNRVIPLGAGQGTAQLTIQRATLGTYSIQTTANPDGSTTYYLEDSNSVAQYGRRTRVLSLPDIRPITNSDSNIVNAANALKLAAEAYLARHLAPQVVYDVSVRGLSQAVRVGDTVRLWYRGIVDRYGYVDLDTDLTVLGVKRNRSADGNRSATLTVATVAEQLRSDADIVLDLVSDMRALKLHVPTSLTHDRVGPYVRRMAPSNTAEFTVDIGSEVLALNYAKLRFRTSPLKSSVTTVASGGGSTQTSSSGGSSSPTSSSDATATTPSSVTSATSGHTHIANLSNYTSGVPIYYSGNTIGCSGGGYFYAGVENPQHSHTVPGSSHSHSHSHTVNVPAHTHDVTIPDHTHNLVYGLFADSHYPQNITLAIDGNDVTAALGGPWAASDAAVEVELDITTYLVNASGGLRQKHRVAFGCSGGSSNRGEIEMECEILSTIQAIAVS